MSFVDLHCHLLPGVDDGAPTIDDSVEYAQRLRREGVREVLATPHLNHVWPLDPLTVAGRVRELDRQLRERGAPLHLHVGAEIAHARAAELSDRELQAVAAGPPQARWLLVEAPFGGIEASFRDVVEDLQARGFGLVIAHPERSPGIAEDGFAAARELVGRGAVLQVNVCSLLGAQGLAAQEAGLRLLRSGLAYVLASDAHPGTREHTQALGFHLALKAGASSVQAWQLTQSNPRFLLRQGIPAGRADITAPALAEGVAA